MSNDQLNEEQELFLFNDGYEGVDFGNGLLDDSRVLERGDDHEKHFSINMVFFFELNLKMFAKGLLSEVKKIFNDFLLFFQKFIIFLLDILTVDK